MTLDEAIGKANCTQPDSWDSEIGSQVVQAYRIGTLSDMSTCLHVIAVLLTAINKEQTK